MLNISSPKTFGQMHKFKIFFYLFANLNFLKLPANFLVRDYLHAEEQISTSFFFGKTRQVFGYYYKIDETFFIIQWKVIFSKTINSEV